MVRIRDMAIAWIPDSGRCCRPSSAGPMGLTLTGNVADGLSRPTTGSNPIRRYRSRPSVPTRVIAGPNGSTPGTLVAGWVIQDIRTHYNASTDTMFVGIQGYKNVSGQEEIFGDSTGNPNAALDPNPNFGGDKSIAIPFAPVTSVTRPARAGTSTIIAGIPPTNRRSAAASTVSPFAEHQYGGPSPVQLRPAVAPVHRQPGLQPVRGAARPGIHDQEFQPDPGSTRERLQRLLHAGLCRLGR